MRPLRSDGQVCGGHLMGKQSVDLEHAKELWNEWEIHCLILVSLFLQVFLSLTAEMRRRSGSRVLLTVLWLAYLSADTVAIFVLGHLTVNVRGPSHELMFFWAPFVLVHLGGQDTITAFSKQDNELWRRHLLSLVSQVALAGYVVSKSSWPDARLRAAMVLMFLRGFFKYAGRTLCLYLCSPKSLRALSLGRLSDSIQWLKEAEAKKIPSSHDSFDRVGAMRVESRGRIKTRFEKMFVADRCWKFVGAFSLALPGQIFLSAFAVVNDERLIIAADELPDMLEEFKNRPDRCMAYQYVAALLVQAYNALYTKTMLPFYVGSLLDVKTSRVSGLFMILTFLIHILFQYLSTAIALVLFVAAEKKRQYSQADIIVSYLLLVGAIILDLLPIFTSIVSHTREPFRPGTAGEGAIMCLFNCVVPQGWQTTKQWSEELAQYSMIRRYSTSNACMPSLWKWTGKCFGAWCVEFFDTTSTPVTDDLKLFVLDKLLLQASRQEWDIASFRGERALEKWMGSHQVPRSGYAALHTSVSSSRVDFPRSVLILHIATDICYFSMDKGRNSEPDEAKKKMMSRELSLYIMYLVFKCNVMFTSISRLAHEQAHERLKEIISGRRSPQGNLDEKEVIMEVIEAMKKEEQQQGSMLEEAHHDKNEEMASKDAAATTSRLQELLRSTEEVIYSPVLSRAHAVAYELMADDEASRWDLILEVWLEVLFYTAPRCGADFHYEHLCTGGEFITHVLLLMQRLGPFLPKPGA